MPYPQAALLAIRMSRHYRPGQHHHGNGILQHAFATSPWLGATVVALIVLAGLVLALIKKARLVLEGTPWSVRLALLVTAGFGIFRLLRRLVLCTACATALQGQDYKREVPESAARAIRRGAA